MIKRKRKIKNQKINKLRFRIKMNKTKNNSIIIKSIFPKQLKKRN